MTIDELKAALAQENCVAFLRMLRVGEGTSDEDGYRRIVGGQLFDSFADHPRVAVKTKYGWTSAAGAYQFMAAVPGKVKTDTWGECVKALGLTDFSAASQDLAAVFLINRRGALTDVLAGRIESAIRKCNPEWASLPGSPYGQHTVTLAKAIEAYAGYGGTLTQSEPVPYKESPVDPFTAAALAGFIQAAPALIRVFGDSPQAEKNAKAAEVVASVAKEVTGAGTAEGALTVINAEPGKAAEFREAVHQSMGELLGLMAQAVDIDEKSRASAVERNLTLSKATGGAWLWLLGGVAGATVLFAHFITYRVLFSAPDLFSEGVKMLLLGQVVLAGFALVMAFLYGTNVQNRISQQDKQ